MIVNKWYSIESICKWTWLHAWEGSAHAWSQIHLHMDSMLYHLLPIRNFSIAKFKFISPLPPLQLNLFPQVESVLQIPGGFLLLISRKNYENPCEIFNFIPLQLNVPRHVSTSQVMLDCTCIRVWVKWTNAMWYFRQISWKISSYPIIGTHKKEAHMGPVLH